MKTLINIFVTIVLINFSLKGQIEYCLPDFTNIIVSSPSSDIEMEELEPVDVEACPECPPPPPPPPLTQPEYRQVYWVHGLNGNSGSWSHPSAESEIQGGHSQFPARKLRSLNVDYFDNQYSWESSASHVNNQFLHQIDGDEGDEPYDDERSIVFAHSQGSIVSRYIDYLYQDGGNEELKRKFGGLITFGGPNQGAPIIENVENLQDFLGKTAYDLIDPYIEPISQFGDGFIARILGVNDDIESITDGIENLISKDIGEFYTGNFLNDLAKKYEPDSPEMQLLNSYEKSDYNTQIVAFYGIQPVVELGRDVSNIPGASQEIKDLGRINMPLSWATIHYFLNAPAKEPAFEAQRKEPLTAARAVLAERDYEVKADQYNQEQKFYAKAKRNALWTGNLALAAKMESERQKAKAFTYSWRRGVKAWQNFNLGYLTSIGIRYLDYYQVEKDYCVCRDEDNYIIKKVPYSDHKGCEIALGRYYDDENCGVETFIEDRYSWKVKPSDGVLPAESAMNIPQATWDPQDIKESTHMEMRNNNMTIDAFDRIYAGEVGKFFKTSKQ